MYTKEPKEYQYGLFQDKLLTPFLDKNNELLKIAKAIDWNSLSDKLSQFYCPDNGRPTKSSRAKIGLLIFKHLYRSSDEETINTLKCNIYLQYLCNISIEKANGFCDPTTLVKFRKKIGLEGIKIIEEEVFQALKRAKLLKGRKLICDTTVVPSNIAYPTDVSLLEKVRQKAVKYLETAKKFGAKTYRTYKRIAKKVFVQYQKIRHHTIKSRRRTQKKIRQFAERNVKQLKEVVTAIKRNARNLCDSTSLSLERARARFIKDIQNFLSTAISILAQQRDIYKGLAVEERIVSLHQPHIRPMVRGKYPVEVEFGPKTLLSCKNKFLFLDNLQFNNISDTHLLDIAIKGYKVRFGHTPTQLTTDKGFWSPHNQSLSEKYGISKIAIENKGKSSHLRDKPFRKRLYKLRCSIEAKISLAKRKFGLNRILYNIPNGEEIWIRLGLIAMNLKTATTGYG